MEITVSTSDLLKELTATQGVVERKTTIPILSNFLFEAAGDRLAAAMQQLLDNPFLLLFLGIAMPTVLYIIWGVMEIVGIPIAK